MFSAAGALARTFVPLLAVAALVVGIESVHSAPAMRLVDSGNPLAGQPFYVDPASAAMSAHNANPGSAQTGRDSRDAPGLLA